MVTVMDFSKSMLVWYLLFILISVSGYSEKSEKMAHHDHEKLHQISSQNIQNPHWMNQHHHHIHHDYQQQHQLKDYPFTEILTNSPSSSVEYLERFNQGIDLRASPELSLAKYEAARPDSFNDYPYNDTIVIPDFYNPFDDQGSYEYTFEPERPFHPEVSFEPLDPFQPEYPFELLEPYEEPDDLDPQIPDVYEIDYYPDYFFIGLSSNDMDLGVEENSQKSLY